jgi:S1-C subfamily serine protease
VRYTFALIALATATGTPASERVADPTAAAVFIRVLGKLEIEVDSAWEQSDDERDVELGTGSGFIFTPYGHVLTNHHVVSGESRTERRGDREVRTRLVVERIEVLLPAADPDGPPLSLPATVEVSDPDLDLAVLSVTDASIPYLALGDSDAAEPGEDVMVYGFPFGRQVEVGRDDLSGVLPAVSVSRGTVAAVRADASGAPVFLQTSANVNPGNSGGPMVDAEGFVLGVVRLKLKGGDGIGFAVPVNAVKDFLESNGYGGLVPVDRLRLGGEENLETKGLTLRLPEGVEDVSPSRLRAFNEPSASSVGFASDRVFTAWDLERLEAALLSGEAFGSFHASGMRKSQVLSGGSFLLGSATGQEGGLESKIEYAIVGSGPEKVVLRYVGSAEAVAFNRSVLRDSLRSASIDSLLGSPIERAIEPGSLRWEAVDLPAPSAPSVVFPPAWEEEFSAPFPCRGLPPVESAVATSPPGDFRISLRAGWWNAGPDPEPASRMCSARASGYGASSYAYAVDYLGVRYLVSGAFTANDEGLLQLEAVAPLELSDLVADLTRAFLDQNLRNRPPR